MKAHAYTRVRIQKAMKERQEMVKYDGHINDHHRTGTSGNNLSSK